MLLKLKWFYLLFLITVAPPIQAARSNRELDETTTTVPTPTDEKCTPCNPAPPPPPPVPCPPPPALPPPSPPKKPPSTDCPPPPSFIYITGPPGNLYPVDSDFGSAAGRTSAATGLPALIGCGVLGLLIRLGF